MTPNTAAAAIRIAWITFALFWLASSRRVKRTNRPEARSSFVLRWIAMAAALLFAFLRWGVLARPLLPYTQILFLVAAVVAWVGVLFAIWARVTLGRNWSSSVTLKDAHDLIQTGPYRFVRHPIYSGMLLSFAGTALFLDRVGGLIGLAIVFTVYYGKARQEEKLLAGHFGAAWQQYRSRTQAIIPFFL